MNRTRGSIIAATVVVVIGAILLFQTLLQPVLSYDEGFILEGARRVLHGQFPNNDFWTIYPPAQYKLIALAYQLMGESITSARIVDATVRTLLACVSTLLVYRVTLSIKWAILAGLLPLLWLAGIGFVGFPGFPALLIISSATAIWALAPSQTNPTWSYALAGCLFGGAAAFRHDLAGYSLLALITFELVTKAHSDKQRINGIIAALVSVAITGLVLLTWMTRHVPANLLIEQLIFEPARVMPTYRWTPWPALSNTRLIAVWLVPILVLLSLVISRTSLMTGASTDLRRTHLAFSMTSAALLAQMSVRKDIIHATPAWIILLPALCLIWYQVFRLRHTTTRRTSALAWITLIVCLFLTARPLVKTAMSTVQSASTRHSGQLFSRAGWASLDNDQTQLLDWLATQGHDTQIYIGVTNHDQFSNNEPAWYFLSGRGSPVYLHELHPGIANSREAQSRTVAELAEKKVEFVILTESPCDAFNASCRTASLGLLDHYIQSNYTPTAQYGRYRVLVRHLPGSTK
jgi:hypothetical protein